MHSKLERIQSERLSSLTTPSPGFVSLEDGSFKRTPRMYVCTRVNTTKNKISSQVKSQCTAIDQFESTTKVMNPHHLLPFSKEKEKWFSYLLVWASALGFSSGFAAATCLFVPAPSSERLPPAGSCRRGSRKRVPSFPGTKRAHVSSAPPPESLRLRLLLLS